MKRLLNPSVASSTSVDRLGNVGKKLSGAAFMPPGQHQHKPTSCHALLFILHVA